MKLKRQEVKAFRDELAKKQGFMCALCGNLMHPEDQTLDHDHTTGHVRRVLHRSCNAAEGKILSWCKRTQSTDPLLFLQELARYWIQSYEEHPIHPAHLTDEEKLIKKYRRLLKKSKRERTKQKYRDLITEVQSAIRRT